MSDKPTLQEVLARLRISKPDAPGKIYMHVYAILVSVKFLYDHEPRILVDKHMS